jgi:hypothetical protein
VPGFPLSRNPPRPAANSSALSDYERYDGIGLAEPVKAREVSAGELLEAAVARVEQHNPTLNAVVNLSSRITSLAAWRPFLALSRFRHRRCFHLSSSESGYLSGRAPYERLC